MLISRNEILNYIRNNYEGYEKYDFGENTLIEEKDFIIINDIYNVDETSLDLDKDILVCNLIPERQTNVSNIRLFCDSLNADGSNLGDEIYKVLERNNPLYTKSYLKNGANWTTLESFFLALDKAKELSGCCNPRSIFNISKYIGLDKSIFDSTNLKMQFFNLRTLYEIFYIDTRKANFDLLIQPVTSIKIKKNNTIRYETLLMSKYFKNFELHSDMKFDHEFHVDGIISGLSARKNRPFADIKTYYYCYDLLSLLIKDYQYLKLNIKKTDASDGTILLDNKPIAHQVLLKKEKILCSLSPMSKFMIPLLNGMKINFPKFRYFYNYEKPVEISDISKLELNEILKNNEGILVYKVDKTVYDEKNKDCIVNIVVEEGEMYNAKYNLTGVKYIVKPKIKNSIDYGFIRNIDDSKHKSWFNIAHNNRINQIQRMRLFETALKERQVALIKAKQAEEAKKQLEELNQLLEQRIFERTVDLQRAKDEMELKEKQKTDAFINISHEIKTPLTLIGNYLDKQIKKYDRTEELDIIVQNVSKLKRDIINFLDFEKLEKNLPFYDHSQISDLSDIVAKNVIQFKELAGKKEISIKFNISPNIYSKIDPVSFDSIVCNLINNAIKFTNSSGEIAVKLKADNNEIELLVSDTGIGISKEMQENIFKPYYQISHKKSNIQGIGMGLNIVKKIIDTVGGIITIKSKPGQGSTFIIKFKQYFLKMSDIVQSIYEKESVSYFEPVNIRLKENKYDKNKKTILIVEDNLHMLSFLQDDLISEYNIFFAFNGKEALNKMKNIEGKPDLIISDIMMDIMDGYEFYSELLKDESFNTVPFIFLTAKGKLEDRLQGLQKGAVDYITKPFNILELKAKLTSLLKIKDAMNKERLDEISSSISSVLEVDNDVMNKVAYKDEGAEKDELYLKYGISRRQVEVFSFLEQGFQRKEIADFLNIDITTVKTHIERMFRKFNVNNKTELINIIRKNMPLTRHYK